MVISHWLAGIGVAMVVALGATTLPASARAADEPDAAITRLPDDTAVATVDGKPVTAAEIRVAFEYLPQQSYFLPAEFLLETVLQQIIDVRLMADAALADGADTAAVDRQVAFYRQRLLRQEYLRKRAEHEITPALIRERYDAMLKNAVPEDEVRAHHILVKTEAEANALATELAGGAEFETLAKANSIDESTKVNGGDLGYFKKDRMVPEFAAAAFATEVGKVSAPVQTSYGWHLIRVDDHRQATAQSFEEVVPQLRDQLTQEAVERATQKVRDGAKIEITKLDAYAVLGLPKPPPSAPDGPKAEEPKAEGGEATPAAGGDAGAAGAEPAKTQ
jgi:peptidyl-prolyl cis-trans isomerase C